MTNTEKAVTWGLLGLIAWELWKPAPTMGSGIDTIGNNIPLWVKQLSRNEQLRNGTGIDFFRRTRGLWGMC
jgi:hypothetical protein